MATIYELREDTEHIEAVQMATLTRPGFGLRPVPALFGSPEWWSTLGTSDLPILTVRGVIDEVYWASMGDYPECKVLDATGDVTTWTRAGDHTRYVEGLCIEIDYVIQWAKEDADLGASGLPAEREVVIAIRVEDSDQRSNAVAPRVARFLASLEQRGDAR